MGRKKNTHYKALNAVQEREKRKRDSGEELSLGVTDAQADEGLVEPEPEASDEGLELKSKRRAKSWEFAGAPEFTADLDQAPFPASSRKRKRNSLAGRGVAACAASHDDGRRRGRPCRPGRVTAVAACR